MLVIRIKQLESRIKLFIPIFLILTALFLPSPVYAVTHPLCDPKIPGDCPAGLQQIEQVFTGVISAVVGLGFIACLVMLVLAGIKYLTSGGEPKAIQSAHQTVSWAFLGILFMAVAWIVLRLIESFTGVEVTLFNIRTL